MSFQQHYSNDGEGAPLLGAPGVHFHPTDEELMGSYLKKKVANSNTVFDAIGEVDFNKCEPWDLPAMAKVGDQGIFYFFSLKDRKYPTGMRTNRATRAGYWKPTGRDREVIARRTGKLLGMKRTLVFYTGRAPKSAKTSWIMHEYRLQDESKSDQKPWVVCKVFEQKLSNEMAAETSNCNGGSNAKCSTFQPCSYLPEPPDYSQGGTSLANPEPTLKQANSTLEYLREPLLGAPGVHFHPTDEELMSHYLTQKVANSNSVFEAVGEVDFNKCEPWDLPEMAKVGDQGIFYFFSLNIKDRKYATGMRTNRATQAGHWKPTGRDRKVITRRTGRLLGLKKTLVFYTGRGAKSGKTSWIMHEYRLQDESKSDREQWVVCKVFDQKSSNEIAAETSNCNGDSNAASKYESLESPGSDFVKPNTLSEPPDYFQGGTSLANPETTLKEANSTLENLVSGSDMGSSVPIWDLNVAPASDISDV